MQGDTGHHLMEESQSPLRNSRSLGMGEHESASASQWMVTVRLLPLLETVL